MLALRLWVERARLAKGVGAVEAAEQRGRGEAEGGGDEREGKESRGSAGGSEAFLAAQAAGAGAEEGKEGCDGRVEEALPPEKRERERERDTDRKYKAAKQQK